MSLSVALVALAATFTGSALADAAEPAGAAAPQQADGCYVSSPQGASGKLVLPSNAPAIPLLNQSFNAVPTLAVDPVGDVTFTSRVDDRATRALLIVPSKELPLGSVNLNWKVGCSVPSRGNEPSGITSLVVTDAAPLPTTIGTLEQGKSLVLTLSPELSPFLQVVSIDIRTADKESQPFLTGSYGAITNEYSKISIGYSGSSLDPAGTDTYYAGRSLLYEANAGVCVSRSGSVDVPVTITAHVAGAASDPPALTGTVSVDCDLAKRLNEEAQSSATQAGSGNSTTTSAGCSASPSTAPSAGLGFFAAAFAVAAIVRRRLASRTKLD